MSEKKYTEKNTKTNTNTQKKKETKTLREMRRYVDEKELERLAETIRRLRETKRCREMLAWA